MEGIRFKGKKHFVREWDEVDRLMEKAITNAVLRGTIDPPQLTVEEWDTLKTEFLRAALIRQGATQEELEAMQKDAEAQALEMIAEHEQHLQRFKVVEGGRHGTV